MAGERKRIRDDIKAAIETVFAGEVIASRVYDARDKTKFVSVYFETGDIEWDGIKNFTTAPVVVSYLSNDISDDDAIDKIAESIHAAIESTDIAPGLIQGFVPAGFEYLSEADSAFCGLALRYTVIY